MSPVFSLSRVRREKSRGRQPRFFEPLALATGPIAGACTPARVGVSRSQHAQQGRTTAGTTRPGTPTNPGNRPGPFKPIMHRCVFLSSNRFVHQTKPPQGETRPRYQVHASPFPWSRKEPEFLPARPSWLRIVVSPLSSVQKSRGSTCDSQAIRIAFHRPFTTKTAIRIIAWSRSQIARQVSITSDNSSIYFDPRHFWRSDDSDDQKGEAVGKAFLPQPRQN